MCRDLTLTQQWKCLCLFCLISLRVLFLSVPVCDSSGDSETRCPCLFVPGSDFFIPVSLLFLRVSDFLMGDVENGSSLRLAQTRRSRVSHPHADRISHNITWKRGTGCKAGSQLCLSVPSSCLNASRDQFDLEYELGQDIIRLHSFPLSPIQCFIRNGSFLIEIFLCWDQTTQVQPYFDGGQISNIGPEYKRQGL